MALIENTLFGEIDRVKVALERLKAFEPTEGYWVADSGGKDSEGIIDLVKRSGVKADYHPSLTTVDAPQVIRHIRKYHPFTKINMPEIPLLHRIAAGRIPPTRTRRWCCEGYKERGGYGRFVVTGVRKEESAKRNARKMIESCYRNKTKKYLNVIIDWSELDVWEYINGRSLPYCSLYDEPYNFKRVGCILCPMVRDIERQRNFFPKIYEAWHRAILRCYDKARGKTAHASGEEMWQWWLNRDAAAIDPDQTVLFE